MELAPGGHHDWPVKPTIRPERVRRHSAHWRYRRYASMWRRAAQGSGSFICNRLMGATKSPGSKGAGRVPNRLYLPRRDKSHAPDCPWCTRQQSWRAQRNSCREPKLLSKRPRRSRGFLRPTDRRPAKAGCRSARVPVPMGLPFPAARSHTCITHMRVGCEPKGTVAGVQGWFSLLYPTPSGGEQ